MLILLRRIACRATFCVALALAHTVAGQDSNLAKGRLLPVLDARVGLNIRLGDDPALLPSSQRGQAEPHLVRHLLDPELLLATFQEGRLPDGGALACGYAISSDGGLTWGRQLIPQLTTLNGGRFTRATDPVADAGPQGDLYLQTLGSVQGVFDQAAVVVSRSSDRGATWTAPRTVFQSTAGAASPDKNWLAVQSYPGAPNAGRLISTWTSIGYADGRTQTANLVASISDDRGETWSAPVNITPFGTLHQGSLPLFLADGKLVVIYMTFLNTTGGTTMDIRCKVSADGGRTFPANATTLVPSIRTWDDPQVREGEILPAAAVARTTGEIFVTYVGMIGGTPRVFVTRSADQGTAWTPPLIVSDQPDGISVMNPAIAASPDGRTVTVFFMDKRHAPEGRDFVDFSAATSFDGGRTWGPNVRLSEVSSELRYGPPTGRGVMLGDYFGLIPPANSNQPFVAIWCDTRTGDSDPFIARYAARPEAGFQAWSIAHFDARTATDASLPDVDTDGDGYTNLAEFHLGTDPLRPEPGLSLIVRPRGSQSTDVLWLERAAATDRPLAIVARDVATDRNLSGVTLTATDLPTEATDGLLWRGMRLEQTVDRPAEFRLGRLGPTDADGTRGLVTEGPISVSNSDSRLVNLSVRGRTGGDAGQTIVGFAVDGRKDLLVRAAGPALTGFGLEGTLGDPRLSVLASGSTAPRLNDNWSDGGASAALFARLGAFPFAAGSSDSSLTLQLVAQSATALVSNATNSTGITLVEVYDADPLPRAPRDARLVNLSARSDTGDDGSTLVAGFVLEGTQPRRVLLRAVGPGLKSQGLTSVLADPLISLWKGNTQVAANDDWSTGRSAAAIAAAAEAVAAFPLARDSLDAALFLTLSPGAYTVVVAGAQTQSGVALVEIYDVN